MRCIIQMHILQKKRGGQYLYTPFVRKNNPFPPFFIGLSLDDLKREATICHMLKHPHIVELLETYRQVVI